MQHVADIGDTWLHVQTPSTSVAEQLCEFQVASARRKSHGYPGMGTHGFRLISFGLIRFKTSKIKFLLLVTTHVYVTYNNYKFSKISSLIIL